MFLHASCLQLLFVALFCSAFGTTLRDGNLPFRSHKHQQPGHVLARDHSRLVSSIDATFESWLVNLGHIRDALDQWSAAINNWRTAKGVVTLYLPFGPFWFLTLSSLWEKEEGSFYSVSSVIILYIHDLYLFLIECTVIARVKFRDEFQFFLFNTVSHCTQVAAGVS